MPGRVENAFGWPIFDLGMLETKHCVPCAEGVGKLQGPSLEKLRAELNPAWSVEEEHHLRREFKFKDFKQAWNFTNKVADLAEQEGHHPDILLSWGMVRVTTWTHKVGGLTENDFILARRIDQFT